MKREKKGGEKERKRERKRKIIMILCCKSPAWFCTLLSHTTSIPIHKRKWHTQTIHPGKCGIKYLCQCDCIFMFNFMLQCSLFLRVFYGQCNCNSVVVFRVFSFSLLLCRSVRVSLSLSPSLSSTFARFSLFLSDSHPFSLSLPLSLSLTASLDKQQQLFPRNVRKILS